MKKIACLLSLVAMTCGLFAQDAVQANAVECPVHFYAGLAWDSRYVCDGLIATDDAVASAVAGVTAYGFFADVWSQFDMTGINNNNGFTNDRRYRSEEIDYTIGYSYTFDTEFSPITVGAKWQYYQYPRATFSDDCVAKAWLSLDDVLPDDKNSLGFGVIAANNFTDEAAYGDAWTKYGYAIDEKLTASLTVTAHFYSANKNGGHSAVNDIELKPAVDYALTDNISLSGYMACSRMTSKTTRRAYHQADNANHQWNWWGGVALNFFF